MEHGVWGTEHGAWSKGEPSAVGGALRFRFRLEAEKLKAKDEGRGKVDENKPDKNYQEI